MACWSMRGCDEEMMARCPHAVDPSEQCPITCQYAACDRPTHAVTSDPAIMFDPGADRRQAARATCTRCVFFLTNGPRL